MSVTAPQIQTQQTTPSPAATSSAGQEDFEDLPPQNDEGEEISMTSGDAVEGDDPGFIDFESLLSRPAAASEVPAAPTEGTPPVGDTQVQPVTVAPAQTTPIVTPQPVTAQPQVAPQPGQAPTPQQVQEQQPQVTAQPTPQVVANPEQVLAQLQQGVEQTKEALVQHVASHYEKLISDEDVELLQTEPKKALAALAGKIHVDGLSNILSVLSSNLPTMVYGMMDGMQKNQKATDEFYGKYTMFDRAQHGPAIVGLAKALRQANPQLDAQTFESMLAATAMAHLRIQPQAPQQRQPAQTQQRRGPRGFAPAGGGQPPAPQANPHANNPWAGFVEASMND